MNDQVTIALALVITLDLAVSWRILASEAYERSQKIAQLVIIWLVPLLGALVCLLVLRQIARPAMKRKTEAFPNEYVDRLAQNYPLGDDSSCHDR